MMRAHYIFTLFLQQLLFICSNLFLFAATFYFCSSFYLNSSLYFCSDFKVPIMSKNFFRSSGSAFRLGSFREKIFQFG